MSFTSSIFKTCAGLFLTAFVFGMVSARAAEGEAKFEAILVWGSNDEKSPDPKIKPADERIVKKLKNFKWTHYYEVARKDVTVNKDETKVQMSKDCQLVIRRLENGRVEVRLIGKGKEVGKITQEMKKGACIVTGGNATNSTGWFIILKQTE